MAMSEEVLQKAHSRLVQMFMSAPADAWRALADFPITGPDGQPTTLGRARVKALIYAMAEDQRKVENEAAARQAQMTATPYDAGQVEL
jgi:hypothetical protein